MEIEIIKIKNKQNSTLVFGNILNNFLSSLKILHWYSPDINLHYILDDLYSDLSKKFDKLQEEIIEVSRYQLSSFPVLNENDFLFKIEDNIDEKNIILIFDKNISKFLNLLNSIEINNFIKSNISGLNNTKEDIVSIINKSKYLISIINLK
jgi:hypothetical protein